MIAALALLLALQDAPRIEKVEPLVGNVRRPLLWTPLKVTLTSASDFSGDLVARSDFGFSVARSVNLKAGGRDVVLLPALNPVELRVGKESFKIPDRVLRPDKIVIVDSRLPYAGDLVSTEALLYQIVSGEDLAKTLPRGLLEAAALVLVKEPMDGGVVAATREEAEKAVAAAIGPLPAFEAADRALWPLAPRQRWVPAKKTWAIYFATLYAFASFVALTVVAKRFPKFGLASLAGLALLGIGGYGVFPLSQMWVVGQGAEVVFPTGQARDQRLWFVQSALEIAETRIEFPRLVKPVFPTAGGAETPFRIRVEERGCVVEGLRLEAGRAVCFGGGEPRAATVRLADKTVQPLKGVVLVRGGRVRFLGDLAAGAAIPVEAAEGGIPPGADFDAWKRFVGNDGLFGIQAGEERPAGSLHSPDLVDEQERPAVFIQRFQ